MSWHLPWYKRNVDAWRSGTRGMSLELRGFYNEILDEMWDRQGPLVNDAKRLAMATQCNPRKVRQLLAELIALGKVVETAEGLINRRMQDEIADANFDGEKTSKFRETSSKNRETSLKVSKKPMFSTRDLELERDTESKGDFDFKKREVEAERKRQEAIAYEKLLEEAEGGTTQ